MMTSSCMIGWWVAFLVMSLFFSGTEMAFVASDKFRYAVTKKRKGPTIICLIPFIVIPGNSFSRLSWPKESCWSASSTLPC